MTQARLEHTLRSMVRRYGFEQVVQSLHEIGLSERGAGSSEQNAVSRNLSDVESSGRRKPKVTATGYVAKMDLPAEKEPAVADLARRFEDKAFLPSFGDIANFCRNYGIAEPASKSRASAIPRVFKHLAAMDTDEVQSIIDHGYYSGPSRLGPIADAIRNFGKGRREREEALTSSR